MICFVYLFIDCYHEGRGGLKIEMGGGGGDLLKS